MKKGKVDQDKIDHDKCLREEMVQHNGKLAAIHYQDGRVVRGEIRVKTGDIYIGDIKLDGNLIGLYRLL